MPSGVVKWFNAEKGYGFIQPNEGGRDVFVHAKVLRAVGLDSLAEGDVVEFDGTLDDITGKVQATNIVRQLRSNATSASASVEGYAEDYADDFTDSD